MIGSRNLVPTGMDPWSVCGNAYNIPPELMQFLTSTCISRLTLIVEPANSTIYSQAWKFVDQLGILDNWHDDWLSYTNALSESHVQITEGEDELILAHAQQGSYSPKDGYTIIFSEHKPHIIHWWWRAI